MNHDRPNPHPNPRRPAPRHGRVHVGALLAAGALSATLLGGMLGLFQHRATSNDAIASTAPAAAPGPALLAEAPAQPADALTAAPAPTAAAAGPARPTRP